MTHPMVCRVHSPSQAFRTARPARVKGTRWRSMFIGLAALSLLAMTCGAVVPMLFPGASPFIYLWVPSLIYIVAGIVGIGAAIASFRN